MATLAEHVQTGDHEVAKIHDDDAARVSSRTHMPPTPLKLVIVDTNCYVRLYLSPVRPIMGSTFSGYLWLPALPGVRSVIFCSEEDLRRPAVAAGWRAAQAVGSMPPVAVEG